MQMSRKGLARGRERAVGETDARPSSLSRARQERSNGSILFLGIRSRLLHSSLATHHLHHLSSLPLSLSHHQPPTTHLLLALSISSPHLLLLFLHPPISSSSSPSSPAIRLLSVASTANKRQLFHHQIWLLLQASPLRTASTPLKASESPSALPKSFHRLSPISTTLHLVYASPVLVK